MENSKKIFTIFQLVLKQIVLKLREISSKIVLEMKTILVLNVVVIR